MHDVIVAGGGPAGSTAARALARGGARVLLLEKETMPRRKPCGGVIPALVPELAGLDAAALDARPLGCLTFTWKGVAHGEIPLPPGGVLSVARERFDHLLLQHAASHGAEIHEGCGAEKIVENNQYVEVEDAAGSRHRARHLLIAWGARPPRPPGFSSRARRVALSGVRELPHAPSNQEKAWLDLGVLRDGYVGVVDKGSHLLLGYYLRGKKLPGDFGARLSAYCAKLSLEEGDGGFQHRVLPLYAPGEPLASGRTLLIGDAAGLVDPLSGEGIRHAVKSGLLAAQAILEGLSAEQYCELVLHEIGRELALAWKLAGFAYRFPRASQEGMLRVGKEAVDVLNGRQTYLHLLDRLKARLRRTFGLGPVKGAASSP